MFHSVINYKSESKNNLINLPTQQRVSSKEIFFPFDPYTLLKRMTELRGVMERSRYFTKKHDVQGFPGFSIKPLIIIQRTSNKETKAIHNSGFECIYLNNKRMLALKKFGYLSACSSDRDISNIGLKILQTINSPITLGVIGSIPCLEKNQIMNTLAPLEIIKIELTQRFQLGQMESRLKCIIKTGNNGLPLPNLKFKAQLKNIREIHHSIDFAERFTQFLFDLNT